MYSALSTLNTTTEVPLSKAPNPQLLPRVPALAAHCSGCVFTTVCVHFGWVKCRAQYNNIIYLNWENKEHISNYFYIWCPVWPYVMGQEKELSTFGASKIISGSSTFIWTIYPSRRCKWCNNHGAQSKRRTVSSCFYQEKDFNFSHNIPQRQNLSLLHSSISKCPKTVWIVPAWPLNWSFITMNSVQWSEKDSKS